MKQLRMLFLPVLQPRRLLIAALLACVIWPWSGAAWIYLKAQLAQYLIADAWQQSLQQQTPVKPWPWADTWPVARMQVPELDVDLMVLQGSDGSSLAFGPGLVAGTAAPGEGASVIGGHRDTHFRFLQRLKAGMTIHVQNRRGQWLQYTVIELRVVNSEISPLVIDNSQTELVLVTCYPFDTLQSGGPLRYLASTTPTHLPGKK